MRFSVLVVDDEKMPREILRNYVPWETLQVGRVEEAEDGAQALEMARLHRPDIVISDVKMPRMNGLELASAVREMYPDCQFIFLSGYTDKEYLKGAIKLRAASYVEKPIDLEELITVVREVTEELEKQSLPDPQLLFYRGENGDFSQPNNGQVYVYEKAVFTALGNLIRHKRRSESLELTARIYRELRQCEGTPPEVVRNIYCQIVFALLAAAESRNITAVTEQGDYLLYTAAKQPTLWLLWQALTESMQTYFQAVESNSQDLVTRVDKYLAAHLSDSELTVQAVASELGFVHTYLCSAYKKNSGLTVNQKLTELRMERAKNLLADPTRKLYEVAHDVGYLDGKYFVKLFTKEVGISPRLYRENLCCHEE
ncbi:response regulator [uncultured Ruthenibacterium sp.]|uniref:response regulator n=1 Tax=uncultured Ruthenibacterium sp. TaxID=1905347 RepID=UPI00349EE313